MGSGSRDGTGKERSFSRLWRAKRHRSAKQIETENGMRTGLLSWRRRVIWTRKALRAKSRRTSGRRHFRWRRSWWPPEKRPRRDMNVQIAICQAVAISRRYGWTMAVGEEDVNCVLTKTAFGLAPVTDYYTEGNLCCGMYTATKEAGARTEEATDRLPAGKFAYLVTAPAARADFAPDAVIIYGNPAQVMRLVTGALWKRGGAITSSFTGRVDCSDEIIRPFLS